MRKIFVAFVALLVSTVTFALPTPPDDSDPMAQVLEQYSAQVEEMNKKFDQAILPPLQGLLQVTKEFGNTTQDTLTPEQEKNLNQYQSQLMKALTSMVAPIVAEVNMEELNAQVKQFMTLTGQSAPELSKEDFTDLLLGMTLISAINHFAQANLITKEDVEILEILFFSQEEEENAH